MDTAPNKKEAEQGYFHFWKAPLTVRFLLRRYQITESESREAMSSLAIRQADRMAFISWFLMALSVAYMIMFYALGMHPDDKFYSVIAMFILFGSSLFYAILGTLVYFLKLQRPLFSRLLMDAYTGCLLAVMALYFLAAAQNASERGSFCPSYLYLLIFTLVASPYLFDSLFAMLGGLTIVVTISAVGQSEPVLLLQYILIGAILLAAMVYLSSTNYINEARTMRLNFANDELHFLSTHDQLTGIKNRHSLHTDLAQDLPRYLKEDSEICFIMFDIDSFKKYHDTLSHIDGDNCLQVVVNSVKKANLFSEGAFYRFGGDEFLIVLPGLNPKQVKRIGHGVVKAVYDAKLPSAVGAPYPFVSVSAGAFFGPVEPDKKLDDYLAEADKQLYLAKNSGHNRFYFQGEESKG
jgi:diguanylate cyclase (GGDEF)-like protein